MSSSKKHKVALGMSGGVDSSLAAKLLVDQGYDVTGVYLECWSAPGCRTDQDRKDALQVALSLNIPFTVLDFKDAYRQRVVEYFFQEYQAGRTPNPDVMCNKEIKFGLFYEWAMDNGFDAIATGHYAQVGIIENKNTTKSALSLISSQDSWKDQTYFLYRLTDEQLAHTLFPIGHLSKKEVRQMATNAHLAVAHKKDSVGICFIGDINVHEFLRERLGENPGQVIDRKGRVIGEHKGLWFYTVGQRHGFSIYPKTATTSDAGEAIDHHNIPPFYVISKDAEHNQLIVGFGEETYQHTFKVSEPDWISPKLMEQLTSTWEKAWPLLVRIRHIGQLHRADFNPQTKIVTLVEPTQGIAEGQSAVFYLSTKSLPKEWSLSLPNSQQKSAEICLGGAIIKESNFNK